MQIDLLKQLAIIAEEGANEFQRILMYVSLSALAAIGVGSVLYASRKQIDDLYHKWLHLDGFGRWGAIAAIALMTMYGGAKHGPVKNAGADADIGLANIWVETTNVVVSASVTNVYTLVEVGFTNGNVTATTPVSIRESDREAWHALTKINPTVITDLSTNLLTFAVATNVANATYWWVGTNTPPIYVESSDIKLTKAIFTSTSVHFEWTYEGEDRTLFTEFFIQYRKKETDPWTSVASVPYGDTMSCDITGFWIGETRYWRIMSSRVQ